jgi:hypothetical protein
MICQIDEIDMTTIAIPEFSVINEITTACSIDADYPVDLDSPRYEVGLSPHDWIDDITDDLNDLDFLQSVQPPILPYDHHQFLTTDDISMNTPANVLLAINDQINELGLTKTEFYDYLRNTDPVLANQTSVRAHFDGGSMATTTDQLYCLWYYKELNHTDPARVLQVADNHRHHSQGIGFLRLPTTSNDTCFVRCLYTPTLPATIVSPHDAGIQYQCNGYSCASNFDGTDCSIRLHFQPASQQRDICFPLTLIRGLLFSKPVVLPTSSQHSAPVPSKIPNHFDNYNLRSSAPVIRQITREQQRILWHQRLGHIHPRRISQAHKYASGIPVIANATELEKCPICARAKLHKAARATTTSRRASQCFQGISIDFGFIVNSLPMLTARV